AGTTLQAVDDGGVTTTMNALSATNTATTLSSGDVALPMFMDGASPFTDAISSAGSQSVGFAGRIPVNPLLLADPARLAPCAPRPDPANRRPGPPQFHL